MIDIVNNPAVQQARLVSENIAKVLEPLQPVLEQTRQYQEAFDLLNINIQSISHLYFGEKNQAINNIVQTLDNVFGDYRLLHVHRDDESEEEISENEDANNRILSEIFASDESENVNKKSKSSIITLSPVNDKVLEYLAQNPQAFYQMKDQDFEIVMAEIYSKLGYNVEITQQTRDGGKDLIIRKPEILGDFIYYVECKKYAAKRHIGVGIVRNLVGTVNTDRVNGGILATTSFFTQNACKYVLGNKLDCQIKMHDYNTIQKLLKKAL